MSIKADIGAFVAALRTDWLAAMSGGFSVPFAAVSVFAEQKYQPLIWAVLAYSALIYAAFRLWRTQHLHVQALGMRIAGGFRRDIDVGEAVAFFTLGVWGKSFADAAGSKVRPSANDAFAAFLQGAADGDLPVWGKKGASGVWQEIPKDYWRSHGIAWFSLLKGQPTTESPITRSIDVDSLLGAGVSYSMLMTSREAVELHARRHRLAGATQPTEIVTI